MRNGSYIAGWGLDGHMPLRDDTMASRGDNPKNPFADATPRRRDFLLLALVVCGVAIHGSLRPFQFVPLGFVEALGQMKQVLGGGYISQSRNDFAVNFVLFVPIGYFLLGAISLDRSRRVSWLLGPLLVWLCCGALSLAIEFGQLWLPTRYPQLSDILTQTLGTTAGMVLWLVAGQNVADWIRSYTLGERRKGPLDWLLRAYLVGLLIYAVTPLDLITTPGGLLHKLRQGRILIAPFSDVGWDLATSTEAFRDVLVCVPVGMLAATWLTSRERPVRPLGESILLGSLVVGAIEAVQLLIDSRVTSVDDLLRGALGVCVGAAAMRVGRGRGKTRDGVLLASASARKAWCWFGLAVAYTIGLAVLMGWPFEPIADLALIKARYRGFPQNPLEVFSGAVFSGKETWAVAWGILRRGLLFAPLGGLLALSLGHLSVPPSIRRVLAGMALAWAGGVAVAIELGQVFFPPHVSSSNDVLGSVAGAAVGLFVTLWWHGKVGSKGGMS